VHDFAVTQHHLVFLLPSFVYDVERSREGMSFLDAHVWRPELGMRALVLDKNDVTRMRWLQLPAGFVFHLGNAWSSPDGQEIHLDYVRSDDA
ncbi:carotenoid oxygenase family protein, partial [Acinetobacter baumannii]